MGRGDGHYEGGQVGGIGQDGEGTGEESADDLDEEEGAAQEGRDLEPTEDEGALVLVGGCSVIVVVVAKVLVGGGGGRGGSSGDIGIIAPVLTVAMAVAVRVAVRVGLTHLAWSLAFSGGCQEFVYRFGLVWLVFVSWLRVSE